MKAAMSVIVLVIMVTPVAAQWLNHPTPGIPRNADGKPNLTAPAPRTPDGKPDFSGLWDKGQSDGLAGNLTRGLRPDEVPAWVNQLVEERREDFSKGHMSVQCLPFGPASMTDVALSHRHMKIVQTPALIVLLFGGLEYRQIFMDARTLEVDPNPSWMGYSVGRWEGDTLVVESNGYNDRTWLDREGHPHSEALRVTERYRRRDFGHLDIEMTLHDPAVYPKPWTVTWTAPLMADTELLEYVCNENPNRLSHWVGTRSDDKELAVTVAPEILATYAGTYVEQPPTFRRNPGRVIEVVFRDGQLFGKLNGGAEVPLIAQSRTRFAGIGSSIEFITDGPTTTGLRDTHVMGNYFFKRTK
jgi:hypothetical protein